MLLDAQDSQLVLVDYQQLLMPAIHDSAAVLANAIRLGQLARLFEVPVWTTEENPAGLGGTDAALRPHAGEVVQKMAFSGADLLVPRLRPVARPPAGNARSLPKH